MPTESDGAAAAAPQPEQQTSGNTGNTRNRGGRGRGGQRNRNSRPQTTRFEGSTPGMKGNIFDIGTDKDVDLFVHTTRELETWVGRTFKDYTMDFTNGVRNLNLPAPVAPT